MRLIILLACLMCGAAQAAHNPPLERDANAAGYQSEWWRLTASLADRDGRMWNLEWSLYRQHAEPQAAGGASPANGLSLAHVAITTPDGEHHEQRFERGSIVQAGVSSPRQIVAAGDRAVDWEWVSQGAALFPARLSFSLGDRDLNLLLESFGPEGTAGQPAAAATDHASSDPLLRVRGFVDQGANKIYLRGRGRLDRELQAPALAGNLPRED